MNILYKSSALNTLLQLQSSGVILSSSCMQVQWWWTSACSCCKWLSNCRTYRTGRSWARCRRASTRGYL